MSIPTSHCALLPIVHTLQLVYREIKARNVHMRVGMHGPKTGYHNYVCTRKLGRPTFFPVLLTSSCTFLLYSPKVNVL